MKIVFPAIAFAFAYFQGSQSLDWCQELLSPLVSSASEMVMNIPWSAYGEAIGSKIDVVTSYPEFPFTPWILAIVSLVVSMAPKRNVREAGGVLAGSRAVFSIALVLSLVCTFVEVFRTREQIMDSLVIKPSHGCVYNILHILVCLGWYPIFYPWLKLVLGLILSDAFIGLQVSSQLPPTISMTEVFNEARAIESSRIIFDN